MGFGGLEGFKRVGLAAYGVCEDTDTGLKRSLSMFKRQVPAGGEPDETEISFCANGG
jgi:hypothetical protein